MNTENTDANHSRGTMRHEELTSALIGAFYAVYNDLGYGFLEKVYEAALAIELGRRHMQFERQAPIDVYYQGQVVGSYLADILVNNRVIIELKAVRALEPEHDAQLLNYLNATRYEVGLLLNFGPQPQVKRKIFDNARKRYRPHPELQQTRSASSP
jgi:GxxExxY protein